MLSMTVAEAFISAQDSVFPAQHYISALLDRGVRVLIYVGVNDWGCNWVRRVFTTWTQAVLALMFR